MDTRRKCDKQKWINQIRQATEHLAAACGDGPRHDLEEIVEAAATSDPNYLKQRTVRLPRDLYSQVEAAATKLNVPMKSLVREILLREIPRLRTSE